MRRPSARSRGASGGGGAPLRARSRRFDRQHEQAARRDRVSRVAQRLGGDRSTVERSVAGDGVEGEELLHRSG
jgi:hypothetical protein